jgi:hypothetical protein
MIDSYVVLVELEERGVRSILGYRSSSIEKFWLAPIYPSYGHIIRSFMFIKNSMTVIHFNACSVKPSLVGMSRIEEG